MDGIVRSTAFPLLPSKLRLPSNVSERHSTRQTASSSLLGVGVSFGHISDLGTSSRSPVTRTVRLYWRGSLSTLTSYNWTMISEQSYKYGLYMVLFIN